jgi:putative tRNA adenosine deaminase-associated protein
MDEAGVDFAIVAWREEAAWYLDLVPDKSADDLEALERFARQRQGESGSLAFVSVAEEFFVALRIQGARTRFLLSDVNAVFEWPVAEEVADRLELDIEDDEDLADGEPAGDLTLLLDYGLTPADLEQLCGDLEMFPDEQIGSIAARVGFGEQLSRVLDSAELLT